MRKTVCIGSLNTCIRRNLDARRLKKYFELNGYEIVERPADAAYTFVFTCAFTKSASSPNLEEIKQLAKMSTEVVVCGCLPAIEAKELEKIFSGKTIIADELDKINEYFPENKIKLSDVKDENTEQANYLFSDRQRNIIASYLNNEAKVGFDRILRIAHGCMGNCSYCVIRKATGKLKSKPLNECLNEYEGLLKGKVESILIDAEDTGAYGLDIGVTFINLLSNLLSLNDEYRQYPKLYLRSFNPVWVVRYRDELSAMVDRANIIKINCPIQSGSARILKLMKRYANIELIGESLCIIRKKHRQIHLDTHLIIGFPTEKDEDLIATIDLCKKIEFDSVELYGYSDREDTVAHQLYGKIPKEIISRRLETAKEAFEKEGTNVIRYE